jgi:chromosome segregation ATPase
MSEQEKHSDDMVLGVSYSALEKANARLKILEKEILNMFFKIDKLERELVEANEENEKLKADVDSIRTQLYSEITLHKVTYGEYENLKDKIAMLEKHNYALEKRCHENEKLKAEIEELKEYKAIYERLFK